MRLNELEIYLNQLLNMAQFHDYCPNGLQVEGRNEVRRLVSGVTASFELLEAAVAADADAILVHHGYFWRGEDPCLSDEAPAYRVSDAAQFGLLSYHLPLDAHPEFGNNIQLAHRLGFVEAGRFGDQNIAMHGTVTIRSVELESAGNGHRRMRWRRKPLVIGDEAKPILRVAWCTGGAQDYFDEAIRLGVDAYITGEISERTVHAARESGVAFISAGHHATERYGVQALGEHISDRFGMAHQFIDIDSPV